jgi:hypothetical protein
MRTSLAWLAVAAATLLIAEPALASLSLPIPVARERAARFAKRTCKHDESCADSGVLGCRRRGDRVVLCRIFDRRETDLQGNFVCARLVRLSLDPRTRRVPVTGVSNWHC